jgi:uncharacterized spore protein YtfJ
MKNDTEAIPPRLFHVRTVRGEPYQIGEHTLIPVARIVSWGKAKGRIGNRQFGGWGGGFTRVTPLAVLEQTAEGEQRVALIDGTTLALRKLLVAAVAIMLGFTAIRWAVHKWRQARVTG